MAKSNFIRQTASGLIYIRDRKDKEYLINPGDLDTQIIAGKNNKSNQANTRFKLVTVRRLTDYSLQDITTLLNNQQAVLRDTALRTKQPIPFETTVPTTTDNLNQVYAVYVDEDIYGLTSPVYAFSSPDTKFKCFITANGSGRYDWSVHIIHILNVKTNVDNSTTSIWRLYTIDSNLNSSGTVSYILESSALPSSYQYNFDINSVHYLGGGVWTGMSVDILDRLPIYDLAPVNQQYPVIGTPVNAGLGLRATSIVEYSFTPTYSFTWCRGVLKLNRRDRSASSKYTSPDGVVQLDKKFDYSLNHTYRPAITYAQYSTQEVNNLEFSNGTATYVGCTNIAVASPYQNPDFGTDAARTSIQNYTQSTNVIRPNDLEIELNAPINKIAFQNLSHIPIQASSNDAANMMLVNLGEAGGSINHPYELKATTGSRSYGYSYSYKYWWTYGKVVSFYPVGDIRRFLTNNTTSPGASGTMFDFGQLILAPGIPNAVMTTWDSPPNPPTGYFPYYVGTLQFIIQYLNPPILGHQSVYYYEINPPSIDAGEADNNYIDNSDDITSQRTLQMYYSQILAGLSNGEGLSEFNIGNVTIAANETDTLAMRQPTTAQRSQFISNPETFPNKFWTGTDFTLEND